ncbi:MAG: YgiQ family radical SAM protein, partial [Actinobacteria bacterium]|nr:YgiQ family radical SAM protein [Actinomycetota bacterium]
MRRSTFRSISAKIGGVQAADPLFTNAAAQSGSAPFLPMDRAAMDALGWAQCDIIIVTGDAYVDHPSFGMAIIGRALEAKGFRVGIVAQPRWDRPDDFLVMGRPKLFVGVTAGNMDSMLNRLTAQKKLRSEDQYSPDGEVGKRPNRATIVYSNLCRQAFPGLPIVLGGIEA